MFQFLSKQQSSSRQRPFPVPTPDPFENPLVETNPGQLQLWATALPIADLQQLAEAVLISLGRLNRFPGPVKKREELMAVYRKSCSRLQYTSLKQKPKLPARLHRQLLLEVAYGYLHLVNESLQKKLSAKLRKQLFSYIYYAVRFLALEYLIACEEYDCRAIMTRREIIKLHTLAEEQGLQHERIEGSDETTNHTITQQIKLTLLISLLDPCHLQEGEVRTIYNYLLDLADSATFDELDTVTDPTGHYVIDRLGEIAPYLFEPNHGEALTAPRFYHFNMIPVSQQLHQHLRNIEKQSEGKPQGLQHLSSKAASNLIRRMLKSWHIRLQRGSDRHATSGQAKLWLGIQPIHHFLTGDTSSSHSINGENEILVDQQPGSPGNVESSTYQPLDCWRFNQSRSGVALHVPLPQAVPPKVGDVALIAKPDSGYRDESKIGIIRRLSKDQGILELGIQFINGKVTTLSIQPLNVDNDEEPSTLPGLYIDLGDIDRSSLIVARDLLIPAKEYRVEEMIPAPVISPVLITEVTAMFERFRVKQV